ncbi:MAG TPA: tetratricopeptide repeat protein, partial [bacterium]|nr:tetratricopeptide repeat protein [bacterium]
MRKIISVIILLFYTQQVLSFSFFQRYKPEELYPISSEYFKQNFKKVKREKIKIPEGVLILPLLDKESKLNSLGTLISILATYKYMYLPEKKLNILMPDLESIFGNNFYKDGKIINFRPKQIKRLMEEMRVNTYVTGFFIHNNKNFHVELRFEGPKGDFNIGREGKIEEIIYIPSWIAENVYKYLGVRISKEKREFMNKLDFYDWRDMVEVASVENLLFKNIYCLTPADDKKLLNTYRKFYLKNPDSIFLIIRYANALWEMHNDKEALDVLERVMKKYPDCERILLCYCHILDSKAYEPCGYDRVIVPILMKLLKTEYLNKNVYSTLIGTYKPYNLWEECETLYNFWVENDPNYYLPYQERGKFYIEYAWYARGGGWAYTVTKEAWRKYFQRLNLAEKDLLKAVSLNPEAYNAYARLVQIGYEMDRSYEYIDYFYKRAIEIQPENVSVYFQKFFKLQPKWGGSLDEMYDFIDELIEKNCKDF